MSLDERHRGRHGPEELGGGSDSLSGRLSVSPVAAVDGPGVELSHPLHDGARLGQRLRGLLEQRAPRGVDRLGRCEVLLEKLLDEAGIQVFELLLGHSDPLL